MGDNHRTFKDRAAAVSDCVVEILSERHDGFSISTVHVWQYNPDVARVGGQWSWTFDIRRTINDHRGNLPNDRQKLIAKVLEAMQSTAADETIHIDY